MTPPRACQAATPKVIATANLGATRLTASGSYLYFIDHSNQLIPSIRRIKDDGTEANNVYTSAHLGQRIQDITVVGGTIFLIERTGSGYAALYSIPARGGYKTKLTKHEGYAAGSATLGGATSDAVFVAVPTSKGSQLRRVSMQDGTETVIAEHDGLDLQDIQIVGSDIWFLPNQGLDGYFKVPIAATTSAATQVSTDGCAFHAAVTSAGVFCSDSTTLRRIALNSGVSVKVWDLADGPGDVSPPDGDFFYLAPKSSPDSPGTLRRYPLAGGDPTDVACHRGTMQVPTFNERGVFWLESDPADEMKVNVYAVEKTFSDSAPITASFPSG